MAIATQDPPKEKRDKEILEEDYKSYDSKAAESKKDNPPNNNNNNNDDVQNNVDIPKVVDDTNKNDVPNNDANVNNAVDNKEGSYLDNQDSNNAEEAYHDFDENGKGESGFKKAIVPDFKGPTNDRQTAVVNAFKHAWTGYKKYAWGHDHLRQVLKF